jgi:competence protein ComEA
MIRRLAWLIVWSAGAGLWIAVALAATAATEPAIVDPGCGARIVAAPAGLRGGTGSGMTRPAESAATAVVGSGRGCVNVNRADSRDLARLPGIGPALAQRIIAYRAGHGPFSSSRGLMEVKGIGQGRISKIEGRICF